MIRSKIIPGSGSGAAKVLLGQQIARSRKQARMMMILDADKIDRAVLALLYLGLHEDVRAWKSFDWDAMNRLHEDGFISDPRGKAKSVLFTEEGLTEARRLVEELFSSEK